MNVTLPAPCPACGWQYDPDKLAAARRGEMTLDPNPTHLCVPGVDTWPLASTLDGFIVEPGLAVWDYDLRLCTVERLDHVDQAGTPWFRTTTGTFDGGRLWVNHPFDKTDARTALLASSKPARKCASCGDPADSMVTHPTLGIPVPYCDLCRKARFDGEHLFRTATTIMTLCGTVKRGRSDQPRTYSDGAPPADMACPDGICPDCWAEAKA